jgi:hypothetical protein
LKALPDKFRGKTAFMKLGLAVVVFLWIAGALPAGAQMAATAQPLTISVKGDGAQATRLASYALDAPISVTVTTGGPARIDAMAIDASGPDGQLTDLPLARDAQGTFTGWLVLRSPGTWRLRLTSRAGLVSTDTTPVTLDVELPAPPTAGRIGLLVGGGMFLVLGGGGFLLLRRRLSDDASRPRLQQAA